LRVQIPALEALLLECGLVTREEHDLRTAE
jgi:hypothetical protein